MECNRFLEEKAGQSDSPDFLRHLATCGGCQRDVEEMDDIRGLYRSASVERYPGGVPRLRRSGWGLAVSAAAAVAMVAALVFMLAPRPQKSEDVQAKVSIPFFRVHLEPWKNDLRFDHALDTCWQNLDLLERNR